MPMKHRTTTLAKSTTRLTLKTPMWSLPMTTASKNLPRQPRLCRGDWNQRPQVVREAKRDPVYVAIIKNDWLSRALGASRLRQALHILNLNPALPPTVIVPTPLQGKDSDITLLPFAYPVTNCNPDLRGLLLDRHEFHVVLNDVGGFSFMAYNSTSAPPLLSGRFSGVTKDTFNPAISEALFDSIRANSSLVALILRIIAGPDSLVPGDYTQEGLIAKIVAHTQFKWVTGKDNAGAMQDVLCMYILPLTTNIDHVLKLRNIFGSLGFYIPLEGQMSPWPKPMRCSKCREVDHYELRLTTSCTGFNPCNTCGFLGPQKPYLHSCHPWENGYLYPRIQVPAR
ncbi:hypothetical protein C8F01DRAFT_1084836 [Mycena amicta]|nr:hypothetical protein C8F01DRAFT_1084836 [Mycena amicta]